MDHQEMTDVESQNVETPPDLFIKGKRQVTLKVYACISTCSSIFPWTSYLVYIHFKWLHIFYVFLS